MIIEVKGTKNQQDAESDPTQRYELKNQQRKPKTPYAIGLLLTGIALYLKSIMPLFARQEEGDAAASREPEGASEAQISLLPAQNPSPQEQVKEAAEAEEEYPVGSGKPLLELLPPAKFVMVDSPAIDFPAPDKASVWGGLFAGRPVVPVAANDNADTIPVPQVPSWEPGANDGPVDPAPGYPAPDGEDDGEADGPDGEDEDDKEDVNRAPRVSGPVYLNDVSGCAVLAIAMSDLLRNAYDPDGDALSVRNPTVSSGALTQSGDGWLFRGEPQLEGLVTVTYEITDGALSAEQVAYFSVLKSVIDGSAGDDLILGTPCADEIDAGSGNDNVDSRGGDDLVSGGTGNDHIVAGDGNDVVFAGSGDDIVFGGGGDDHISGGSGNDRLHGDEGDDILFGDAGHDVLIGGNGRDILHGGDGNDRLEGGAGDDILLAGPGDDSADGGDGADLIDGGEGNDRLTGGAGDDVISDGGGSDVVDAGSGDDRIVAAADGEDDHHDGGEGCDAIDYSETSKGVTVNLVEGTACGEETGNDTITSVERVIGGKGEDHFIVGGGSASLTGGDGDDVFEFFGAETPSAGASHLILDFTVGDRIRMSKYDLFEEMRDAVEDRFEDIYGEDFDDDDIPIRFSHDRADEMARTRVEADLNNDDVWETTFYLQGHHALMIVEYA